MKEYEVTITKTTIEKAFIQAEDEDDLDNIINSEEYEAEEYPYESVNYDIDGEEEVEDE